MLLLVTLVLSICLALSLTGQITLNEKEALTNEPTNSNKSESQLKHIHMKKWEDYTHLKVN